MKSKLLGMPAFLVLLISMSTLTAVGGQHARPAYARWIGPGVIIGNDPNKLYPVESDGQQYYVKMTQSKTLVVLQVIHSGALKVIANANLINYFTPITTIVTLNKNVITVTTTTVHHGFSLESYQFTITHGRCPLTEITNYYDTGNNYYDPTTEIVHFYDISPDKGRASRWLKQFPIKKYAGYGTYYGSTNRSQIYEGVSDKWMRMNKYFTLHGKLQPPPTEKITFKPIVFHLNGINFDKVGKWVASLHFRHTK